MISVTVVRFVPRCDMRSIHKSRLRYSRGLKRSQAVLTLNKSKTIARVIDCTGGIHQWYAEEGSIFDVREIQRMVNGLALRLALSDGQASEIDKPGERQRKASRV